MTLRASIGVPIGYTVPVRKALAGKANVHRIPENGADTVNGLKKIDSWLGDSHWDVIHFNWGLHDLKVTPDGGRQVPIDAYEKNLAALMQRLKATGAQLIWATTTRSRKANRTRRVTLPTWQNITPRRAE